MVAVGLFVKEDTLLSLSRGQKGLFRGGGLALLGVQCVACVAVAVWSCLSTGVLLFVRELSYISCNVLCA